MSIRPPFSHEHPVAVGPVRLKFWGVRGSISTPGPQTVRFGGNTSCVELRADGQVLILDAGTGLRPLGAALGNEFRERAQDLTLLISHTHWDHIQGFPFFSPAYQPQNRIRILGYRDVERSLQEALLGQMSAPFFPVALQEMPGEIVFEELRDATFQVGSIKVTSCRTNHPGVCHSYRMDTSAGSICYVPDHETIPESAGAGNEAMSALIKNADIVILDAQYTADEYEGHKGWGHGSMDEVIRVARGSGVKQLYLFHHDPSHEDEFLDKMVQRAKRLALGTGMRVDAAREGEQVLLAPKGRA